MAYETAIFPEINKPKTILANASKYIDTARLASEVLADKLEFLLAKIKHDELNVMVVKALILGEIRDIRRYMHRAYHEAVKLKKEMDRRDDTIPAKVAAYNAPEEIFYCKIVPGEGFYDKVLALNEYAAVKRYALIIYKTITYRSSSLSIERDLLAEELKIAIMTPLQDKPTIYRIKIADNGDFIPVFMEHK